MSSPTIDQRHSPLEKVRQATLAFLSPGNSNYNSKTFADRDIKYWVQKAQELEQNGIFALDVMAETILGEGRTLFNRLVKEKPFAAAYILGELQPVIEHYSEADKNRSWWALQSLFIENAGVLLANAHDRPEYVGYWLENLNRMGSDYNNLFGHYLKTYRTYVDIIEQKSTDNKYCEEVDLRGVRQVYKALEKDVKFGRKNNIKDVPGYAEELETLRKRLLRIATDNIFRGGYLNDYRWLHSTEKDSLYGATEHQIKMGWKKNSVDILGPTTSDFLKEVTHQISGGKIKGDITVVGHMQPEEKVHYFEDLLEKVPDNTPIFCTTAKTPEDVSADNIFMITKRISGSFNDVAKQLNDLPKSKKRKWHDHLMASASHFMEAVKSDGFREIVLKSDKLTHDFEYDSPVPQQAKTGARAYISVLDSKFIDRPSLERSI